MPKQRVGLFLGRFQPFHNAHLSIIKKSFDFVDYIIIGVGSSQYSRTKLNPFSYEERVDMIVSSLHGIKKYMIMPIPDINDPPHYVDYVVGKIPPFDVVFSNNQYTIDLFRKNFYFPIILITPEDDSIRGTAIREAYYKGDASWKQYVPKSTETIMSREYPIRFKDEINEEKYGM